MTRDIKVGDWVKTKEGVGRVKLCIGGLMIVGDIPTTITPYYYPNEVKPIDKRTAFLTRLGALLKEFNAFLSADAVGSYCGDDVEKVTLIIGIADECVLNYNIADPNVIITADNIMGFEKDK